MKLSPLKAGGPYTLTISTPHRILKYTNVLIGEVWLCSGQSNMEFMLRQTITGKKDIPQAADEQLRLYDMKARWRTDAVQWDAYVLDSLNHLQEMCIRDRVYTGYGDAKMWVGGYQEGQRPGDLYMFIADGIYKSQ